MKRFFIISTTLLLIGSASCDAQSDTVLEAKPFFESTNNDTIQLLDVRTSAEFNSGHIKNAMLADWLTPDEFNRRVQFLDKSRPVYVYCLSGGRSAAAAKKLFKEGYAVYELKGGINNWKANDLPLTGKKASNKPQQSLDAFNAKIAKGTVLVDVGAEWCPPCRKMEPVIEKVRKQKGSALTFVTVDGGNDEDIMKAYQITQLPVFLIFKDGKQVWRRDGVATEDELLSRL